MPGTFVSIWSSLRFCFVVFTYRCDGVGLVVLGDGGGRGANLGVGREHLSGRDWDTHNAARSSNGGCGGQGVVSVPCLGNPSNGGESEE